MNKVLRIILLSIVIVFMSITDGFAEPFPHRPPLTNTLSDKETVVIVETSRDYKDVWTEIKEVVPNVQMRKIYRKLFSGFSLEVAEKDLPRLERIAGIKRVNQVVTYHATLDESVSFIGGERIRNQLDRNGDHLTGKGIKIAVIDTGVDYTHPDLKRSYKGGFDVVDNDGDPMETTAKQGAPTLHGTHVAGIIAANGKIKGVAPEAELFVYRALGPGGKGTTEQVIEAIEKAVEDEVDIINLSLGNNVNGPDWPTSVALDKAVELGVVAVTSNGNSGPKMWTVGSPGTSNKAISVGASSPPLKTPYLTIFKEDKEIPLQDFQASRPWAIRRDFPIMFAGIGRKDDFVDADGKIALVKRGMIPLSDKIIHAKAAGAKAVLIANNTKGLFVGAVPRGIDLMVAAISSEDGEWLEEMIAQQKDSVWLRTIYREEEDLIAPFSSRGPVTQSWLVKPDVVAPGVAIESTIPKGYLGLNGTSMSAPHVAGASALVKQAHPDWSPEQIKAALMNTAKTLTDREGEAYMPHVQGAGRIQVDKAVAAKTLVYPGAVSFGAWSLNDRREIKTVKVTVDNQSNSKQTYYVDPPLDVPDGIQWKVPFSFSLEPKQTKEITLTMDIMPNVLSEGIHHGKVKIKGGDEEVVVPYLFFIEEPNYPRLMAFNFEKGEEPDSYRYELYLPGGAKEAGIALYDPDTFEFVTYLDAQEDIDRGLLEAEIVKSDLPDGIYKALIFANQNGKEDTIERTIAIGEAYYPPVKPNQEEGRAKHK